MAYLGVLSLLCLSTALIQTAQAQTTNPILDHPDPYITPLPVNGEYLLLATAGRNITIWHGPSVPTAATKSTVVFEPKDGLEALWSPTIWHMENKWWIYFTAKYPTTKHAIYVLESDTEDPLGPYAFRGQIDLDRPVIDPSILKLNSKNYLMYVSVDGGENAIRMVELAHPMKPIGNKSLLTEPDQPWEKGVIHSNYPVVEGPTALYHADKTFIVYSGSNTMSSEYCLGLLTYTGGNPLDKSSWKKSGPVFRKNPANGIYSPGRGTFAHTPDGKTWWLLYHAKTIDAITMAGRKTRAQRFTWNADGTPHCGIPTRDGAIDTQ